LNKESAEMKNSKNNLNVPNLRFPEFTGEWERTTLGKIGATYNGLTGKNATDFGSGSPFITYKSIFDDSKIDVSRVEYVRITDTEKEKQTQNKVEYGDIFFTTSSETPEEVGMASVLLSEISDCYLNSFCFGYRLFNKTIHLPEFFRFYLRSKSIRRKIAVLAQGSTRFNISKNEVMKTLIFIPSFSEQRKISELFSLIEERIETQKKIIEKYESLIRGLYHYVFNNTECEHFLLKDIVNIVKGKQVNREDLLEIGKYYVMNGGIDPSGYLNEYNTPAHTISISEGGNSCGYVQYNSESFWSGGHCYSLIPKDETTNYQYLYHFLKYKERNIMALRIGSGLPNMQKKDLERFKVILPSVEQQNRIAAFFKIMSVKNDLEKSLLQNLQCQKAYFLSSLFI
jgi:type I restriction enzyme S subunit